MAARVAIAVRRGLCALALAALAACGPIAYVNEVTRRADGAVEEARRADAERLAPYWWTRATEYLRAARVCAARADFEGANRFGRLAGAAARQAIVDASDPSKRPIDATPVPAKERGGEAPAGAGDGGDEDPAKAEARGAGAPVQPAPPAKPAAPAKAKAKAGRRGTLAPAKEAQ